MTERSETAQPAPLAQVERGVGRLEPKRELQAVKWIRVDERLPSTDSRVLVVYRPAPGGKRRLMFARFSGGQWRLVEDRTGTRLPERVTHWMPEPRMPRLKTPNVRANLDPTA